MQIERLAFLAAVILPLHLVACTNAGKPQTDRELRGMGMVIDYHLAATASTKEGVQAITDAGNRLFGSAILNSKNWGVSAIGGGSNMSFPRWVKITWRENTIPGRRWNSGSVAGDHTVPVLDRIPSEVFEYVARRRGRVIVLRFRLMDDGVLLAWDVQERVRHPRGGSGLVYSLHGGDFPCETSPYQPHPDCTDGPLEKADWFEPTWIRD